MPKIGSQRKSALSVTVGLSIFASVPVHFSHVAQIEIVMGGIIIIQISTDTNTIINSNLASLK
jgi:hypothetical protein